MAKFKSQDEELFLKIAHDVISSPEKYIEAGKWLDRYYDNELCTQKQNEVNLQKQQLLEEIEVIKNEIKTEQLNKHPYSEKLSKLEGKLYTKQNLRFGFFCQFETEQKPPIKEQLAYALEDLYKDYLHAGVLSEHDARVIMLIVWVATDAKANEKKPSITKFAIKPWKTNTETSDESRHGLASYLFLDFDIALHYVYTSKPNDGIFDSPIYELNLKYLPMIHRSWIKVKTENEIEKKQEIDAKKDPYQYIIPDEYITLGEQIADRLEDLVNPKSENGLRDQWVGCTEPINISLKGIDELFQWLYKFHPEDGSFLQIQYDRLMSAAKLSDHLLETMYEGDEIPSDADWEGWAEGVASVIRLIVNKHKAVPDEDFISTDSQPQGNEKQTIILKDFIKNHCDLSARPDIDSKCEMLMREHRKKRITLPLVEIDYRRGQKYLYYLDKLLNEWPDYRITLTTLPPLKKSTNK